MREWGQTPWDRMGQGEAVRGQGPQFSVANFSEFRGPVCQIPRLTAVDFSHTVSFLGGVAVRRRTRDRKVAMSTPGRGAIK